MINLDLYKFNGDTRKVDKSLTLVHQYTGCEIIEDMDIIDPIITLDVSGFVDLGFNYLFIPELGRYYFVKKIVALNNGFIKIFCHIDVLKTYSTDILRSEQYVCRQQNKCNFRLPDNEYNIKSNRNLTIKNFGKDIIQPNSNFILTTFGKTGGII